MLVNISYENEDSKVFSETVTETEQVAQGISGLLRDDSTSSGRGSQSSTPNMNSNLYYLAKKESIRRAAGFQPELIIHTPFLNEKQGPPRITSLAYLSLNYLLAYGNENGICIIDIIQKSVVFNISTPDIYGPMDPFQRYSKSPKKFEAGQPEMERGKSPTADQLNGFQSPTNAAATNQQLCGTPTSASSSLQGQHPNQASSAQSTPHHQPHHVLTSQQSFCYSNLNKRFAHLAREAVIANNSSTANSSSTVGIGTRSANSKRMLRMQSLQQMSMCLTEDHNQANKSNFFNLSVGSASEKAETFSRSSSVCSIESGGLESISNIMFAFTFPKNDAAPTLSVWIGTKAGTVTAFPLTFPESQESRELCLQSINIENSNTVFRLKGNILNCTILDLDHNGQVLISSSKGHQPNRNSKGHASNYTIKTRSNVASSTNLGSPSASMSSSSMSNISPSGTGLPTSSSGLSAATTTQSGQSGGNESTSSGQQMLGQTPPSVLPINTQQLLLIVSERQARVIALPGQQMIGKCILSPSQSAIRADIVYIKTSDAHCLFVYFTNGQVAAYALPSLRIIKELELEMLTPEFRIESNVNFNFDAHLIQFASPSEIAKYCANSALHDNLLSLKPTLAKEIEIPEPPKQGLIKAVFSFGQTPFEKDELFSNNAPQPSTSAARTASAKQFAKQPAGIEGIRQAAQGTLAGELSKTRQAFAERGEAIERLENTTERMANEAMNFKDVSSQLVNKYKEKKWYNF